MTQRLALEKLATRYWAITVPLLGIGIAYRYMGFVPVVILTLIQLWHFYWREDVITAFSVQVRAAYLGILLVSLLPVFHWLAWVVLLGTICRVVFNYCFLARTVSLLPWNRSVPVSWELISRTYLTPPTKGSIVQALAAEA